MKRGLLWAPLGFLLIPSQLWAQHDGLEEDQIHIIHHPARPMPSPVQPIEIYGDIYVSAGPLLPGQSDETLSIKELKINADAPRIEDVLKSVAGFTQFRRTDARSANATSQGATFRGLGGNASSRALVLLDGVPQSDPFGGWITWPAFAPNRIESAKITRGGGAVISGPGALAGTIEFNSIDQDARPAAALAYGSRNAVDASGRIAGKLGGGFGFVSASFSRGDGFVPIIKPQRGSADIAAPYKQLSVSARGVAPLGGNAVLQASILAFTDRRTRGTILSGNGGDGADMSVRLVRQAGPSQWDIEALAYLQTRKFQSRFVAIDAARNNVAQTVDQFNVPSTGMGAKIELRPKLSQSVEIRIGGDWRRVVGETREAFTFVSGVATRDREAGGANTTLGAFAEVSGDVGALGLTAAGRLDRWSIADGRLIERQRATGATLRNDVAPNRTGWEPTSRLGARLLVRETNFRVSTYLGWRLPTLNELYRPFRVGADATAANAALQPERMRGAELGITRSFNIGPPRQSQPPEVSANIAGASRPSLDVSLTAFSNRLINPIANVSIGAGPGTFPGVGFVGVGGIYRQRQNVDAISSRGVEVEAGISDLNIGSASLSYAYTDAKMRGSGPAAPLNGLRPAQVPKHMVSANINRDFASLTLRYVSGQFEDDLNLRRLKGAITLDGQLRFEIMKGLSLVVRGENIGNAQVQAAISGTGVIERASPRSVSVGLSWGGR